MRQEVLNGSMNHCTLQNISWPFADSFDLSADAPDSSAQTELILQAQTLLAKNVLYQKIDSAQQKLSWSSPAVYSNVQRTPMEDNVVSASHRDSAVSNLRILSIFCNNSSVTFARAVNLLDRLLGQVQVHPTFLSFLATCCLHIAAKSCYEHDSVALQADEILYLSRCGGSVLDLYNTERLICETLQWHIDDVTSLTFLQLFYQVFILPGFQIHLKDESFALITAKLEVLLCNFDFTRFRADVLALALLSFQLKDCEESSSLSQFSGVLLELQYYCQIDGMEFTECRELVAKQLAAYESRLTKLPRLKLSWVVSRRTLHKMKPSTKVCQDLEPIIEDEVAVFSSFDSEIDSVDMEHLQLDDPYMSDPRNDLENN